MENKGPEIHGGDADTPTVHYNYPAVSELRDEFRKEHKDSMSSRR